MERKAGEALRLELKKVAPGTPLREGLDFIISARTGALIVIGDEKAIDTLCNGGFELGTAFTSQSLFELAKMDGAIILDGECNRILRANVHLVPDPGLPTSETGMRHRAAERVSRQTKALVISISQRRDVVSLYLAGERVILEDIVVLLAKANQALQTLQRYRAGLDEELEHLTALEFGDVVALADVVETVSRFEMVRRVADEVSRYIDQLGTEGRLVRMQAEELTAGVDEQFTLLLRDYVSDPAPRKVSTVRGKISELPLDQFLEPSVIATVLGMPTEQNGAEDHVRPRGYRVLRRIPMLPSSVVNRIIDRFGTLPTIMSASESDLDKVDGVGARRAAAIREGLGRLRERVSV